MIALYAFVSRPRELPDGLELVPIGDVDAVVGPAEDGDEAVVRHGLAVEALLDAADAVLPVRFGERFADVDAMTEAVAPRLPEFQDALARIAGCVEIAVRVARAEAGDGVRGRDGGSYMRARLRSVTADAAAAEAVHARLRSCARESVVGESTLSRLLHDASYLVERERVDDFARTVESYAASHPELSLVCTGPWAPATFAGAA